MKDDEAGGGRRGGGREAMRSELKNVKDDFRASLGLCLNLQKKKKEEIIVHESRDHTFLREVAPGTLSGLRASRKT